MKEAHPSNQSAGSQDGGNLSSLLHEVFCYLLQASIAHDLLSREPASHELIQSAFDRSVVLEAHFFGPSNQVS